MNLYQISQEITAIQEQLEAQIESWEAIVEDFATLFAAVNSDFNTKLSHCVQYLIDQKSKEAAVDKEIERLEALKKFYTNKVKRMKNNIDTVLTIQWIESIDTQVARLSYTHSDWVIVTDESLIPNQYKVEKKEINISLSLIKESIKAWEIVPWAILEKRKNLQIK